MITNNCKQCGKTFTVSDSEIEFYKNRKLSIPKRCKECRKANKKIKHSNHSQSVNIDQKLEDIVNSINTVSSSETTDKEVKHKKLDIPKIMACCAAAAIVISCVAAVILLSGV